MCEQNKDYGGELADLHQEERMEANDDQQRFDSEVETLHILRAKAEDAKKNIDDYLSADDDYQKLVDVRDKATNLLAEYNEMVRRQALEYYRLHADRGKQLHPAISIALQQKIEILNEQAQLDYIIKNETLHGALKINATVFNKVIKAMPENKVPDFVSIQSVPSVKIATDLEKYIKKQ